MGAHGSPHRFVPRQHDQQSFFGARGRQHTNNGESFVGTHAQRESSKTSYPKHPSTTRSHCFFLFLLWLSGRADLRCAQSLSRDMNRDRSGHLEPPALLELRSIGDIFFLCWSGRVTRFDSSKLAVKVAVATGATPEANPPASLK